MESNLSGPRSPASSVNLSPALSPSINPPALLGHTNTTSGFVQSTIHVTVNPQNKNDVQHQNTTLSGVKIATPDKPPKARKRKNTDTVNNESGNNTTKSTNNKTGEQPVKEKKPRKPRNSNVDGSAPRKRQKTATVSTTKDVANSVTSVSNIKPTMSEMMAPIPVTQNSPMGVVVVKPDQNLSTPNANTRPVSSGQIYDPIRGCTIEAPTNLSTPPLVSPTLQASRNTGSASLANLMNPVITVPSMIDYSPTASVSKLALFRPLNRSGSDPNSNGELVEISAAASVSNSRPHFGPKHIDLTLAHPVLSPSIESKSADEKPKETEERTATKPSSSTATPKARLSPARVSGSGLLSSSDLFGGPSASNDAKPFRGGVDIILDMVLNPEGHNTINIAQEIMKKYGRDAINPRAAAHRERLSQIAALADRLDNGSDDAMSVTGSDGGHDSNVDMAGMDDEPAGAKGSDLEAAKVRRRKRVEDYDKEDDFIDDTEMAWEESAAVAKDGFFIYSGPLIKESEKVVIESASGTTRGRGSRRGGGGRSRGGLALQPPTGTISSAKPTTSTGSGPFRGRARGGAARGSVAPKKPRTSKADESGQASQTKPPASQIVSATGNTTAA